MDTRHKSRNYNLLVLCGLLCRLLENAPADGWVSRREVLPWLEDLVGKEGLEELERRIFDCSEEGFCIFDRERDGKYRLASSRPPRLAPTGDEAGLLLWLLERGWGKLFLEPETQELLLGRLEAHRRGAPLPDFSRTARRPDCVTDIRMGNSVLVVSGYFKKDTTTTAADKMARVLEAEAAATQEPTYPA